MEGELMAHPVWIEVCSCGEPTGNAVIARDAPSVGRVPRAGHDGHEPTYVPLCEDGERMTPTQRARWEQANEAFVNAAQHPMLDHDPSENPPEPSRSPSPRVWKTRG